MKLSYLAIISLWICFLVASVYVSLLPSRLTAQAANSYHSSYFHWNSIDPFLRPDPTMALHFKDPVTKLEFPIPPHFKELPLTILFRCPTTCPRIILSDAPTPDASLSATLYDPFIESLNWQKIQDSSGVFIYQQNPTHPTLTSLLQDKNAQIGIEDQFLPRITTLSHQAELLSLSQANATNINSVVTSHSQPTRLHDWYRYRLLAPHATGQDLITLYLTINANPPQQPDEIGFLFPEFQTTQ